MAQISYVASLLQMNAGIPPADKIYDQYERYFIPSPFWRKTREGITSTARFHGMLFLRRHRLVVYHIGDGNMDWQLFAERSLFFQNYGRYDDRATGMLLICDDGIGPEVAGNIIKNTMYRRKRLLSNPGSSYYETDQPQRYSKSPIRLHDQYSRAFLTEEQHLVSTLNDILEEDKCIQYTCDQWDGTLAHGRNFWDIDIGPYRILYNYSNDLFKYLYLFQHLKDSESPSKWQWLLGIRGEYAPLVKPYESEVEVIPHVD